MDEYELLKEKTDVLLIFSLHFWYFREDDVKEMVSKMLRESMDIHILINSKETTLRTFAAEKSSHLFLLAQSPRRFW